MLCNTVKVSQVISELVYVTYMYDVKAELSQCSSMLIITSKVSTGLNLSTDGKGQRQKFPVTYTVFSVKLDAS